MFADLEEFDAGLPEWEEDDDGALFLAVMDAYADRLSEILEANEFSYAQVTGGEPVRIPTGTQEHVKDAIRASVALSRVAQISQYLLSGVDPAEAASLRIAFAELIIAGSLYQKIDPELIANVQHARAHKASTSKGGRKSAEVRKSWHSAVRPAFDEYRRNNPQVTVATQIVLGMDRGGRVYRTSDASLLALVREWMKEPGQKPKKKKSDVLVQGA